MTYEVLIGERKSLVFPVMCHGYLRIDHSDEVAGENYGFFAHDGPITIQTIITPYDVNGLGHSLPVNNPTGYHGITTSKKTMPNEQSTTYQYSNSGLSSLDNVDVTDAFNEAEKYLSEANRKSHEMMIFYNDNLQLSLVNSSSTTVNNPSEYKIKLTVVAGGASDSLTTTNAVITPNDVISDQRNTMYGYDTNTTGAPYRVITTMGARIGSTNTFTTASSDERNDFYIGMKLYKSAASGFSEIGTVTGVSSSALTLDSSEIGNIPANGEFLYTDADKEATYLVSQFLISASYDNFTGNMFIYLNGNKVASKIHSQKNSTFNIAPNDTFIGIATEDYSANTRKQFMGELHELAIISGVNNGSLSLDTLTPNYRNILMYFRFEESDL